ncbi:MAG: ATP-binding protein [Candidatus Fermentibacteraceae bacterium]|nr:ATP-binding protein [Candidatus Fermentibacteraceae bacterium]
MHGYIHRYAEKALVRAIKRAPVTVILGPRQCGKSTLVKEFIKEHERSTVYLDLQNRADRRMLEEPELLFQEHQDDLICLDEIQQVPEIFSILRSEVDKNRRPGRFLILGSASRNLIRQTSESLAGRIALLDLTPFLFGEVDSTVQTSQFWLRGGFPDSLLAGNQEDSFDWRMDFVRTFLERDIPQLGFSIPMKIMERLWLLIAHVHGQVLNLTKLSDAADISVPSLRKYLGILESTFMIRVLRPHKANLKKRLIKSPKIYIRDTGILHSLLNIETWDELLAHPVRGFSWEGLGIEQITALMPRWKSSFIQTSNGAEIDLVLERGNRKRVFEFKASKAPRLKPGFWALVEALEPETAVVVAQVDEPYKYSQNVTVENLGSLTKKLID